MADVLDDIERHAHSWGIIHTDEQGRDWTAKSCAPEDAAKELRRLRDALTKIAALSPHETEPQHDPNTDDVDIAFADGAQFAWFQASAIARAALSPAQKGEA